MRLRPSVLGLRENARVTLPKATKEIQEAGIEIRRQNIKKIVKKYKEMRLMAKKTPNLR